MKGKEKCKALKEIRQKIAEQNDIAFAVSECTHQGDCKGTCPKCESELRYLERQLEIRKNLGKAVVVAGISAGICAPMAACSPAEAIGNVMSELFAPVTDENIAGDVEYIPPSEDYLEGEATVPEDYEGMEGPRPEDIDGGIEEYDPDGGEIDDYTLEGDVVIDPEYMDEE